MYILQKKKRFYKYSLINMTEKYAEGCNVNINHIKAHHFEDSAYLLKLIFLNYKSSILFKSVYNLLYKSDIRIY